MKILQLEQGSEAWKAHRRTVRNASDAPAMMGASPYVTRADLVRRYATGIEQEIDAATQRVFDRGHEVEPALRALAESMIGEDLYPVTAVSDDGRIGASFDGMTLDWETIFEAKQANAGKAQDIRADAIPRADYWQIVHQFAVCETALFCLYLVGDGTREGTLSLRIARSEIADDIPALLAGWQQFDADVAAYQPEPARIETVAAPVAGFGALSLRVEGRVLASNLDAFRTGAESFLARLPKPAELVTDQDFADADAAVKACVEAEDRIKAATDAALAQMADVDAILRTAKDIGETIRVARLALDKAVSAKKESRRAEIVEAARRSVLAHYDAINATLGEYRITPPQSLQVDIGAAIKGKKTLASITDAANTAAATAKIAASQRAEAIRANLAILNDLAGAHMSLFADRVMLCATKQPDDLRNLIALRIADHQRREQERLEAERERIRAEESARLEREQRETELKAAAAAIPDTTPAAEVSKTAPAPVHSVPVAADRPGSRIKLGDINTALAPLSISAEGLAFIGFYPVATEKAAKLYDAADLPRILLVLSRRLEVQARNTERAA